MLYNMNYKTLSKSKKEKENVCVLNKQYLNIYFAKNYKYMHS